MALLSCVFFLGCGAPDPTPAAREFWLAVRSGNAERLAAASVPDSTEGLSFEEDWGADVTFGEAMSNSTHAAVPSTYVEGDARFEFETRLVLTDHGWKVQARETLQSCALGAGSTIAEQLQATLTSMFDDNGPSFGTNITGSFTDMIAAALDDDAPGQGSTGSASSTAQAAPTVRTRPAGDARVSVVGFEVARAGAFMPWPTTKVQLSVRDIEGPVHGLDEARSRIEFFGDDQLRSLDRSEASFSASIASSQVEEDGSVQLTVDSGGAFPRPGAQSLKLRGVAAFRVGGTASSQRATLSLAEGERARLGDTIVVVAGIEPHGGELRLRLRLEGDALALRELAFARAGVTLESRSRGVSTMNGVQTRSYVLPGPATDVQLRATVLTESRIEEVPFDLTVDVAL